MTYNGNGNEVRPDGVTEQDRILTEFKTREPEPYAELRGDEASG